MAGAILTKGWTEMPVRLLLCLVCMVALVGFPVATAKKHCPKAAVQLIADFAPDGSLQYRVPQEEDPEYEPCRCSSRKAAETFASREKSLGSAVAFVMLMPPAPVMEVDAVVSQPREDRGADQELPEGPASMPSTPPPLSA